MNGFHSEGHIFIDGLFRQKPKILKYDAEISSKPRNQPFRQSGNIPAPEKNLPFFRIDFFQDQFDKCRFARPAGTY